MTKWIPWQLAVDSDPQERWILVNASDNGEEHPRNFKFATRGNAEQFSRTHNPCEHGNYPDEVCGLCITEMEAKHLEE